MRKKRHKISDSRLTTLWSKAVKAKYKSCPITGYRDSLEAHHIIPNGRQKRFALRWDIRNGVPLSSEAHRLLHDGDLSVIKKLLAYVDERGDTEHLMYLKHMLKNEFLSIHLGLSEDEYRKKVKEELEEIINESE
jgi:hypothetical protein